MAAFRFSSSLAGGRAGYDGYKRKKGGKIHVAVNTLGHLLALLVTPANELECAHIDALAEQVPPGTGGRPRRHGGLVFAGAARWVCGHL